MKKIWTLALATNIASQRQVDALSRALSSELGAAEINAYRIPDVVGDAKSADVSLSLLSRLGMDAPDWPDYIIACRPEVAALALAIKKLSGNKTKIIHLQSPTDDTGRFDFDLSGFDLIIRQPQENIRGANVISSRMALHDFTSQLIASFNAAALPKVAGITQPILGVLVGGSDNNVTLTTGDFKLLAADLSKINDSSVFILTSRRTGAENIMVLTEALAGIPNVYIDDPRLSYNDLLGISQKLLVTGESLSMATEAAASGKPVSLYLFGDKLKAHPLYPVFVASEKERTVGFYPAFSPANRPAFDEARELAAKVMDRLGPRPSGSVAFSGPHQ